MANDSKNGNMLAKSDTSFDTVFSTGNPVKVRPKKLINKGEILFFIALFAPVAQMDRAAVS
jgi:hypothetical protein